ncbi:MarC family protein [Sinimarinibacterium sp. CAU 1509]|uniref:MarC family protein n=1 Tax=Sinimarinibacterium sp. CAU 1509 TaxID=2562283 RepID=UPI0010ACF5C7|nr:MarC family protein [Sinimarinibacterium sp. CAU 1509]TJY65085.1 MarC family protein [Sinimarinibacterium sp. CAU 1509]
MTFFSAVVLLFLVMDPLGNLPLFLSALKQVPPERQRRVVLREMLIALLVLMLFLFLGGSLLRLLGLSEPALSAAGGIILMIIALRMVFPSREHSLEEDVPSEPFIVPLAIPYVAGPSSMATVLLLMSREPERWMEWTGAVLTAWILCLPIMLSATSLSRRLGQRGLTAIERLMGLILVTIAVEMLMTGVSQWWQLHR